MFGQGWVALLGLCQPLRDVGLKAKGMLPCITEISHFNLQPFQGLVTGKFTHPETSFFFSFLFFFPDTSVLHITLQESGLTRLSRKTMQTLLIASGKCSKVIICAQRVCELIHYAVKIPESLIAGLFEDSVHEQRLSLPLPTSGAGGGWVVNPWTEKFHLGEETQLCLANRAGEPCLAIQAPSKPSIQKALMKVNAYSSSDQSPA